MKKTTLRKSDIRALNEKLKTNYSVDDFFNKKDKVELIDDNIIIHNEFPCFFHKDNKPIPTLKFLLEKDFPIKKVVVDMGAVKFVVSGADIMRPGIVRFDDNIQKDDFVAIVDENNKKPLAIGQMIFDGKEAEELTSGKVIKNIHYVGDNLWNA